MYSTFTSIEPFFSIFVRENWSGPANFTERPGHTSWQNAKFHTSSGTEPATSQAQLARELELVERYRLYFPLSMNFMYS